MPRCYDFSSLNIIAFVFKNSGAKLHFWPSKLKDLSSTNIHYTQFQNHFWHFIVSSTTCECQKFHDQALFQNVLSSSISGILIFSSKILTCNTVWKSNFSSHLNCVKNQFTYNGSNLNNPFTKLSMF